jgi:hypothetical protein
MSAFGVWELGQEGITEALNDMKSLISGLSRAASVILGMTEDIFDLGKTG